MIALFDANTIWRRKFGQALLRRRPDTLLFAPRAVSRPPALADEPDIIPLSMPPGWATRTAAIAMPLLEFRARRIAAARGSLVDTAIFTTFHYLPLAKRLSGGARILYYCSDDYRGYGGWGGDAVAAKEAALCRIATGSIFVSEALRERAIREYDLDPATCFVAPNASEARFTARMPKPEGLTALPGPVFGTVGVFNDRIDFDFLARVAESPEVGSLALVGPLQDAPGCDDGIARLRANPNVHWFGPQPHSEIPAWMAGIDVAVIPYARTSFNHFCSPMRLWDHLAIGQPIMATDACDQIARQPGIFIVDGSAEALDRSIASAKAVAAGGRRAHLETWDDRVAHIASLIS